MTTWRVKKGDNGVLALNGLFEMVAIGLRNGLKSQASKDRDSQSRWIFEACSRRQRW